MRRNLLLLALLALVTSAMAQDDKVTFEGRAAPVTRLLDELSAATGWKVRAAPAMATEFVVVKVKDVPRQELKARLAKVTQGQWSNEEGFEVLAPDAGARARGKAESLAANRAKLQKSLDQRLKMEKEMDDWKHDGDGGGGGTFAQFGGMGQQYFESGTRAVTAFLKGTDLNVLAAIEAGQRVVFSTAPTRTQRPLPATVMPFLARIVKEHNDAVEMERRAREEGANATDEWETRMKEMLRAMGVDPDEDRAVPITAPPAKALVSVSRGGRMGMFSGMSMGLRVELVIYDANGKRLTGHSDTLYEMSQVVDDQEHEYDPETGEIIEKPAPPEDPNNPKLAFSPTSVHYARFTKAFYLVDERAYSEEEAKPKEEVPADLKAVFQRPDLADPLSYGDTDMLFFLADKKGVQLVANIPDSMWMSASQQNRLADIPKLLERMGMTVEQTDGWVTVFPSDADQVRRGRFSRGSIVRLAQQSETKKVVSLDDLAAFVAANSDEGLDGMGERLLSTFVPGALSLNLVTSMDWNVLRLYGSMSPAARTTLQSQGSVPLAALGGNSRQILSKMLFGASPRLEVDSGTPKDDSNPMMLFYGAMMQMDRPGKDYRTEPTEIMPGGLIDGVLELKLDDTILAVPSKWNSDIGLGSFGPLELALFTHFMTDPKLAEIAGEMPEMPDMLPGTRRVLKFTFRVAPDVVRRFELNDDRLDAAGKPFKMSELPAHFKAAMAKYQEALKKTPFPFLDPEFMGGTRGVPPPDPPLMRAAA